LLEFVLRLLGGLLLELALTIFDAGARSWTYWHDVRAARLALEPLEARSVERLLFAVEPFESPPADEWFYAALAFSIALELRQSMLRTPRQIRALIVSSAERVTTDDVMRQVVRPLRVRLTASLLARCMVGRTGLAPG